MELVRFYSAIVKIAMALALAGFLKSCTLEMMGLAAESSATGVMPYSDYTRMLTK
jgi:hypothetical protein